MANKSISTKKPHESERAEEEQEVVQSSLRPDEEDEEAETDEDDWNDRSMEMLDEDDLANMQGPDA